MSGLETISAQASFVVAADCCPEVSRRSALPSRDEKVATRGLGVAGSACLISVPLSSLPHHLSVPKKRVGLPLTWAAQLKH